MAVKVSIDNLREVKKNLEEIGKVPEKITRATVSDIRSRAPAWVSQCVRGVYGISAKDLSKPDIKKGGPKKAGTVQVKGDTIESLLMIYRGRVLTPTHFGMTPRTLPKGKRYTVKAAVFKGRKKPLGHSVFLGSNKGGGYIPFQRTTGKAYPIKAVKTLSLPQMIDNETVNAQIGIKLTEEIGKRFEHAKNRYWK